MDDDGGYPYFRETPYSADPSASPPQAMDSPFGESLSAVALTSSSMRALASAKGGDGDSRAVHYGRCSKLNPNMATHSGVLHQYFFTAYTVYHLENRDVICNQQRY